MMNGTKTGFVDLALEGILEHDLGNMGSTLAIPTSAERERRQHVEVISKLRLLFFMSFRGKCLV